MVRKNLHFQPSRLAGRARKIKAACGERADRLEYRRQSAPQSASSVRPARPQQGRLCEVKMSKGVFVAVAVLRFSCLLSGLDFLLDGQAAAK